MQALIRFKIIFAWYDIWIGFFWDAKQRYLYFFPVPMLGIRVNCKPKLKMFCMACFEKTMGFKENRRCQKCKHLTLVVDRVVGKGTTG